MQVFCVILPVLETVFGEAAKMGMLLKELTKFIGDTLVPRGQ
jgi:hypothetical protein